nr:UBN2_2 domain-containing protein [Tanacetum cinerariifolium]
MSTSTLTFNTRYLSEIEPLTGTNFSTWREQVKLTLGAMDLDDALRIDPPAALTAERAIPESENAKEYLNPVNGLQKPMQINYNTQKEKWKMSELIAMCVQEEERLKVEKPDVVHVATTNSNKRNGSWKGKGSSGDNSTPDKVQKTNASTSSFQGGPKCKFCHKKGHIQKDCLKFKEWLAKFPYNLEIGKKPKGLKSRME